MAPLDPRGPRPQGRHLSEPTGAGWRPDPWQPGGWRWHDGSTWTSWTGPPPGPPGAGPPVPAQHWHTPIDLDLERRALPWAQVSIVGTAATMALGSVAAAAALREVLEPVVDLFRDVADPTQRQLDTAVDQATERQADYWWLNFLALLPLAFLAGMAVWANRVAHVGRNLGYPARNSPGWAAGGWFVPVVNLWFPYQSIVDSVAPDNPARPRILAWWLAYVLGGLATLPVFVAGVFSDVDLTPFALVVGAIAVVQAVLGLRAVAVVHADHVAAVGSRGG